MLVILACVLSGCLPSWQDPFPPGVIIFQDNLADSAELAYLNPFTGDTGHAALPVDLVNTAWSIDGRYLYGLSRGENALIGHPAALDTLTGEVWSCYEDTPFYFRIQGAGDPQNPMDVLVQNERSIQVVNLTLCEAITTLVDYPSHSEIVYSIIGFTYLPASQILLYGLMI